MMAFVSKAYFNYLSEAEQQQLLTTHVPLGHHPVTQDVLLLPTLDRYAGSYVLGVQGTGKSGLLENMIVHDCEVGHSVVVVDPHGDLVDNVVHGLSRAALKRTYVLDMADEGYPFGLNLFATADPITDELSRTQVVDRIMHVFEVLWPDVLGQQSLPILVRSATITLLSNPGSTLVDVLDFFTDPAVRARLVRNVQDPSVRKFWQTQFDNLTPAQQAQKAQPLVNRLTALFMGRSLVRNIVGQRETTINFRRAIEQKQIILVKLPLKVVPQDAALIGTILIAQLNAAVFSFGDIPQAERPGVSLYVDEFQNFATPDFASMFSEGRKFGMRVTLAHQYRNQLPRYLQDATKTARNKMAFQVNPDDAREAAAWFPAKPSRRIDPDTIELHAAEWLVNHGSEDYCVNEFLEWYLRPLQGYRRGHVIEIRNPGADWMGVAFTVFGPSTGKPTVIRAADPLPHLDHLFYEAMRKGSANLSIPLDVARGFANGGQGFFGILRSPFAQAALDADFEFPAHLVVPDPKYGTRWTRRPEGSKEQYYHFVYFLRRTMQYLAAHPIGKSLEANTPAEIAKLLAELPRRTALVRSGDLVGMIQTDNTPPHAEGEKARQRSQHVREQTRATYCRPRAQVERQFMEEPMPAPMPSSPSRQPTQTTTRVPESFWEEV